MKDLASLAPFRSTKDDEIGMYHGQNGGFDIEVNGHRFFIISHASSDGWEAVSIRPFDLDHYPTEDDVKAIKDLFFEESETISTISVDLFRLPKNGGESDDRT